MVMENVEMRIKNGKLTIEVDVSPELIAKAGLTKKSKNTLIGSTRGFTYVPGTKIRVQVNVITDPPKE
jgi:hypothetical protein